MATSTVRSSSFISRLATVLSAWVREPQQVATICPSSPKLIERLVDRECIRRADRIVELGPGAGGTTQGLLDQMKSDSRLLAIEKTEAFLEPLNELDDQRLIAVGGDAAEIIEICRARDFGLADVIVSGIPFSAIPEDVGKRIAEAVDQTLRPGGYFIAYQLRDDVVKRFAPLYGKPETKVVSLNVPPLSIHQWQKPS